MEPTPSPTSGIEPHCSSPPRRSESAASKRAGNSPKLHSVRGMYIKQAAQVVGASQTMIRSWEQQGLIAPRRTASGYRVYSVDDIDRLRRIRKNLILVQGLNAAGVRRELNEGALPVRQQPAPTPGARLRALRLGQGISLRQLSRNTDLSPSYVSAVERSLSTPSLAVLHRLAAALGTSVVRVLGDEIPRPARPVARSAEQRPLPFDMPGVQMLQLATVDTVLEPLLFTIAPGAGSHEPYSHHGDEFIYVLAGSLQVTLDDTEVEVLHPGDAMTFASHRPHAWHNPGRVETRVIWVNTPPTF